MAGKVCARAGRVISHSPFLPCPSPPPLPTPTGGMAGRQVRQGMLRVAGIGKAYRWHGRIMSKKGGIRLQAYNSKTIVGNKWAGMSTVPLSTAEM